MSRKLIVQANYIYNLKNYFHKLLQQVDPSVTPKYNS